MIPRLGRCLTAIVATVVLLLVALTIWQLLPLPLGVADVEQAPQLEKQLRNLALQWVRQKETARSDGYTYAVDVGQLLIYAAQAHDRELYDALSDFARQHLILDDPDQQFTRGMVVWRYRVDTPPDASGTTEMLRIARGLWIGSAQFQLPADRELSLRIIHAYCRHQTTEQTIWYISNYYNLGDPAKADHPGAHFATNSFLLDYDPDFLTEVATQEHDPKIAAVAEKSYALLRQARTPAGLLYDIVQPEVATMMPGKPTAFSPNDVVQLSNAATIAEACASGTPEVAQAVCNFALRRNFNLNLYYNATTGQPHTRMTPGCETYAPLLRLAIKLHNDKAKNIFLRPLLIQAQNFLSNPQNPRLYTTSEILLALHSYNAS